MIKKLLIILFAAILFTSCGKKGDPIYNEEKLSSKLINIHLNIII